MQSEGKYDLRRTFAFATFSGLYIGVACTCIYRLFPKMAHRLFQNPTPQKIGITSTVLDNFVHVPILYLPTFYLSTGMLRGEEWSEAKQSLVSNWYPSS